MSTTNAPPESTAVRRDTSVRGLGSRVVGVFRDPLPTFLVLAIAVGGFLVFAIPRFGGIDEPAHFYRSYQISTGTLVPEEIEGTEFSGACVPTDLVDEVLDYQADYFRHIQSLAEVPNLADTGFGDAGRDDASSPLRCPSPRDTPVTFSTFGSPVPYVPQTLAVLVSRAAGADAGGMLLVGRITVLVVSVALVAIAIRRSPRAKWAICAVGLLPIALFQSVGMSHDALTTAVSLLVVSSALRALDPPQGASPGAIVVEAVLLSVLLGNCKPVYMVLALLFLLPLVGPRRRAGLRALVLAPIACVATALALTASVGGQWRTDADYFGVRPDPAAQRDDLLTAPWGFVADAARTMRDEAWNWLEGLWSVGISVTHWPAIVVVIGIVIYAAVSLQGERGEPLPLHWLQRTLVAVVLLGGVALVLGAQYVTWSTPGDDVIGGVQGRFFVPLLVLLPIAIGTVNVRWMRPREAWFPLALLLVPFLALFAATVAFRMH